MPWLATNDFRISCSSLASSTARSDIQVHREIIGDREVTGISIAEDRKSFAVHFVAD
jgi:hypothetical protein